MDYVSACECGAWHLEVWKKLEPHARRRVPFRCRSWRHAGSCRLWKGAQDFVRIRDGMAKLDHWSHLVLTFARPANISPTMLFRAGLSRWAKLRKRLTRTFGDIKYIQTWEVHRSGFPHIHLAISNVSLSEMSCNTPKQNWKVLVEPLAVACDFGQIGWLERLRSREAFAGYLTKLARELTGAGKTYQVPTNAPRHFRRLRASQGVLPPVLRDPDITGVLHFCAADGEVIQKAARSQEMN
jgi:hypothetical protein